MLSIITLRYNVIIIINVIFTVFSDCDYELRRLKTSHKRTSPIFIALRHRFLKERNNIISVFYILNKTIFLIKLIIYDITRLSLACLDKNIYFYINVFFFMYIFSSHLIVLFIYTHMT